MLNKHWPFVEPTLARNWANIGITLVQLTVLLHWVNKSEKKKTHFLVKQATLTLYSILVFSSYAYHFFARNLESLDI